MDSTGFDTWTRRRFGLGGAAAAALMGLAGLHSAEAKKKKKRKKKNKKSKPAATGQLVRSGKAITDNCIADASGSIELFKLDGAEKMVVKVSGLPSNTEFDVFVIENPDSPFGFSWYQGDLKTGKNGSGSQTFIGRFNDETFVLDPAEIAHQTFHVGVWFNSPADAEAAGCSNTVTPFNGEQNAGIQALTTVPVNGKGPLAQLS
jgi:hypothetical protein